MPPTPRKQTRKNSTVRTQNFKEFRLKVVRPDHTECVFPADGLVGFALERLSLGFATFRTLDSRARVTEHWNERRRKAEWLADNLPKVVASAKTLIREEAYIESRFEICGTGRHIPEAIGANSKDYIRGLQDLCDTLETLRPMLNEIKGKRKLRIDDDENFFLYLMVAVMKFYARARSTAAIYREVAKFINARLLSVKREEEGMDVKDVATRIERYRSRNSETASAIDANPANFLLHVYGVTQNAGLRRS
jgi:hypothetical protein